MKIKQEIYRQRLTFFLGKKESEISSNPEERRKIKNRRNCEAKAIISVSLCICLLRRWRVPTVTKILKSSLLLLPAVTWQRCLTRVKLFVNRTCARRRSRSTRAVDLRRQRREERETPRWKQVGWIGLGGVGLSCLLVFGFLAFVGSLSFEICLYHYLGPVGSRSLWVIRICGFHYSIHLAF